MESGQQIPRLSKVDSRWQLLVDGKPFLILGGQVHNSSMNLAEYMKPIWNRLIDMGINTVLGPVGWEDIEPEEGVFDFKEVDNIIADAGSHGVRLVFLWFASFKNGMSTYIPPWAKTNFSRFPRVQIRAPDQTLETIELISVFSQQCVNADATAFATFMRHLKEIDSQKTVIMVQVENESGILGDSRDRSPTAEAIFQAPVAQQLIDFLSHKWSSLSSDFTRSFPQLRPETLNETPQDWERCFGSSAQTDELFMAYHYALYLEKIVAAGKQEYTLPLYINVWLPKPDDTARVEGLAAGGHKPGMYPSGEQPTIRWTFGRNLPLQSTSSRQISTQLTTPSLARPTADGTKPFSFPNSAGTNTERDEFAKQLVPFAPLEPAFSPSTQLKRMNTRRDSMFGFFFDQLDAPNSSHSHKKSFGQYELTISRAFVLGRAGPGTGIIIETGPGRFILIGMGFKVQFRSMSPTSKFTGILTCAEKRVVDAKKGIWETVRRLNGDETKGGSWVNMPNENPDYGDQFIPMCMPAGTMMVEVEVYSLDAETVG